MELRVRGEKEVHLGGERIADRKVLGEKKEDREACDQSQEPL